MLVVGLRGKGVGKDMREVKRARRRGKLEGTYVGGVTGVGLLKGTGDQDGRRVGAAAARDGDLGAGDVELGNARWPGVVNAQGLDAEEVIAWGNAAGDGCCVGICKGKEVSKRVTVLGAIMRWHTGESPRRRAAAEGRACGLLVAARVDS